MHKRYFLIIGIVVLVALGSLVYYLNSSRKVAYVTAPVTRGAITQEILASGNVESPTVDNLSFRSSGKLISLTATTGQHVQKGDVLAKQDSSILDATLLRTQANTDAANAELRALEEGATTQTIAVSNTQLTATKSSLNNSYTSVSTTLADAHAKAVDAVINQLADFFFDAQTNNPKLTFNISNYTLSNKLKNERIRATTELHEWKKEETVLSLDPTTKKYDATLSNAMVHLTALQTLLKDAVSAVGVSSGLSVAHVSAYRISASVGLSEINVALKEVQALQHIISVKNAAVASAQANLNLTTASPTQNSIDAQKARVASFEASVAGINAQIRNLEIIAPMSGIVTDTTGTVGEIMSPNTTVVSLMPDATLQVKVNVSEDNIVGVAVGNPAHIELDAFPRGTNFYGTVSAIDPAQTVISGAVYYKTTLLFDKSYKNIRPGMTANVQITTASSSDALLVPASAVTTTATSSTVSVLEKGTPVTRTVTTALTGLNGDIQISSGLSAGEEVITGKK